MTLSAMITNTTNRTAYVLGYPLAPGETKSFPFVLGKISIVTDLGYVILDERGTCDSNSRLRLFKKDGFNIYHLGLKQ